MVGILPSDMQQQVLNGFNPVAMSPSGLAVAVDQEITFRWATVEQLDPVRIRFDGESMYTLATPDMLVQPDVLRLGDRVWVQLLGRRMVMLGIANGGRRSSFTARSEAEALAIFEANRPPHGEVLQIMMIDAEGRAVMTTIAHGGARFDLAGNRLPVLGQHTVEAGEFLNSWTNYASTYDPVSYYKTPDGIVKLEGMLKGGVANPDPPGIGVAFILPEEYRPDRRLIFPSLADQKNARVDITADGEVVVCYGGGVSPVPWVSLAHITFPAADAKIDWHQVTDWASGWAVYADIEPTATQYGLDVQVGLDDYGRAWSKGLARGPNANATSATNVATLPADIPRRGTALPFTAALGQNQVRSSDLTSVGVVRILGGSGVPAYQSYYSFAQNWYANPEAEWAPPSTPTGMGTYGNGYAAPVYRTSDDALIVPEGMASTAAAAADSRMYDLVAGARPRVRTLLANQMSGPNWGRTDQIAGTGNQVRNLIALPAGYVGIGSSTYLANH